MDKLRKEALTKALPMATELIATLEACETDALIQDLADMRGYIMTSDDKNARLAHDLMYYELHSRGVDLTGYSTVAQHILGGQEA